LLLEETQDGTELAALRNRLVLEMYPVRTAASQQFMSTDAFVGFPQPSSSNINWTVIFHDVPQCPDIATNWYIQVINKLATGHYPEPVQSSPHLDSLLSHHPF
jgi:hypothetical protein